MDSVWVLPVKSVSPVSQAEERPKVTEGRTETGRGEGAVQMVGSHQ